MPARSGSCRQCSRVWTMVGRAPGGLDPRSLDQAACSALSQVRACSRSLTRANSSGGGWSFPLPEAARAAAQAAL
jgi:hypothetical protein